MRPGEIIINPRFPKHVRTIHKRFVSSIAFALQLHFHIQEEKFGDY
jgi:hypothetical protein